MKQLSKGVLMFILFEVIFPFYAAADLTARDADYSYKWKLYLEHNADTEPETSYPFESCFKTASEKYGIPYSLLLAVARGESFFNPKAISHKNCYGIMQIKWPETAKHLGIDRRKDLFNPCQNIFAGAKYLRELLDRYEENVHLALAAYNYGPGRIPKNATLSTDIPDGANNYSGYIYNHMKSILGENAQKQKEKFPEDYRKSLAIITFNQPYRARGFLAFMDKKAPSVEMDIFKTALGRFQVVLLYQHEEELNRGREILKNLGIEVIM